jgi:hypothetical protein
MMVGSLLSASYAPWQTDDLKDITVPVCRKMAAVMANLRSHIEYIFTEVNSTVYP